MPAETLPPNLAIPPTIDNSRALGMVFDAELESSLKKVDGRKLGRKSVGGDKLKSVDTAFVTQSAMAAGSVGQSQFKYETGVITISGTNTSGTATITSGSIILGAYLSTFSGTPTVSYFKLTISGTTLTATVVTAPGAGNSIEITVVLLKT